MPTAPRARIVITVVIDPPAGAPPISVQSAGTTLTLQEIDLRAIAARSREQEDAPTGEPASADEVIEYLSDVLENTLEIFEQQYRDAGGPVPSSDTPEVTPATPTPRND